MSKKCSLKGYETTAQANIGNLLNAGSVREVQGISGYTFVSRTVQGDLVFGDLVWGWIPEGKVILSWEFFGCLGSRSELIEAVCFVRCIDGEKVQRIPLAGGFLVRDSFGDVSARGKYGEPILMLLKDGRWDEILRECSYIIEKGKWMEGDWVEESENQGVPSGGEEYTFEGRSYKIKTVINGDGSFTGLPDVWEISEMHPDNFVDINDDVLLIPKKYEAVSKELYGEQRAYCGAFYQVDGRRLVFSSARGADRHGTFKNHILWCTIPGEVNYVIRNIRDYRTEVETNVTVY